MLVPSSESFSAPLLTAALRYLAVRRFERPRLIKDMRAHLSYLLQREEGRYLGARDGVRDALQAALDRAASA